MNVIEIETQAGSFGSLLRHWRTTQGLTQLELANRAASTTRYVSFLETGRSRPGKDMVLRLAEALHVPDPERHDLLRAAGFQPVQAKYALSDAKLEPYRKAIHYTVSAHEPYPSFALNRWYDIVEKNQSAKAMFGRNEGDKSVNLIEAVFDDEETACKIENWSDVARAMVSRLRREALAAPGDHRLQELLDLTLQKTSHLPPAPPPDSDDFIFFPVLHVNGKSIRTISMIARFSENQDIFMNEIRVETLFPYDETAKIYFENFARNRDLWPLSVQANSQ